MYGPNFEIGQHATTVQVGFCHWVARAQVKSQERFGLVPQLSLHW